jgi:hypothetical protein
MDARFPDALAVAVFMVFGFYLVQNGIRNSVTARSVPEVVSPVFVRNFCVTQQ